MLCRELLEAYLHNNHVPFDAHLHQPAYTAQAVAEREHIPGQMMIKVVMVVADGAMVMLAIPTSRRIDLARLSALLDAREVRLATEPELVGAFPDCEAGAMPPFGNLYNLPVYVDRSLEDDHTIFFQAGTHSAALSIDYADFKRLVAPKVAEFTHAPKVAEFTHTQRRSVEVPLADIRELGGW